MEDTYAGFDPWPIYMIVMVASLAVLGVMMFVGRKIKPRDSPALDVIVDIIILVAASSVIAAVSTTPLVSSIVSKVDNTIEGGGSVLLGVVLGIALVICVITFVKYEKWWILIIFGVLLQVGAIYIPQINDFLGAWISGPVNLFWDTLGSIFELIFGTEIS
jgi:hypothetical protein